MEPKQNPKFDIHRSRGIIFNVSLAISLLLVITASKWSVETPNEKTGTHLSKTQRIEMEPIPIVHQKTRDTPTPKPITTPETKPAPEAINLKAVSDSKPVEERPTDIIDQNNPMIENPIASIELPVEKPDSVFLIVEKMPEPVGGWEGFFKTLQGNMKYPRKAQRENAAGKVYVGFTVNERGGLENFSIEKGIGFGCDEEALRVIALTKWNPGKQRGRPVKVRMVQPVVFSLGTP